MPTYEYACKNCGNQWELDQRISEPAVKKCPKCGKLKAERLLSGGGFILKGGGWYSDLYSSTSKSSSKASSESSESAPAPASTESTAKAEPAKIESKPKKAKAAAE